MKHRLSLLSTTSIGVTLVWLALASWSSAANAFDVDDGEAAVPQPTVNPTGSRVVRERMPTETGDRRGIVFPKILRPAFAPEPIVFSPLKPGEATALHTPDAPMTPILFKPLTAPVATVPVPVVQAEVTRPAAPMTFDPLKAGPAAAAPTVKRLDFPPVAPEVAARAQAELQANPPVPAPIILTPPVPVAVAPVQSPPQAGYIAALPQFNKAGAARLVTAPTPIAVAEPVVAPLAPLPVAEVTPVTFPVRQSSAPIVNIPIVKIIPPQPVAAPAPITAMTPTLTPEAAPLAATPPAAVVPSTPATAAIVPPAAHAEALSRSTKSILSTIPSKLDTPQLGKTQKLSMSRTTPALDALDLKSGKKDAYEAAGIKISVSRPGLDTNYELNRAFTAVSGGDNATAMQIYKDILSAEPTNPDALFGLASIYHRQGQLDKARPLYGTLLKNYPSHREGINNFLVLVSDESPQEALAELERLEQRNPDFSPIPAQQALLLERLGYASEAQAKMARAIELSPDNLTYKYNLAIMLDRQKNYAQASALYRLLIDASSKGATIPASADALQKRLNYIANVSGAPVPVIN